MKVFLLAVCFVVLSLVAKASSQDAPVSVSVAIPADENGKRILWYGSTFLHVVITNTSEQPQRLWSQWCMWGTHALKFELTDERGKQRAVHRAEVVLRGRMGLPSWQTLEPHESLVYAVPFTDDQWTGFPVPRDEEQTFTMQAIYEFAPDANSLRDSVWTGRAFSKPIKVTFRP